MKTKTYGCRASAPMSKLVYSKYGGNTSCMTVESKGRTITIDAGSGLLQMEHAMHNNDKARMQNTSHNILLSHLHLDHIIGLGMFAPAWAKDSNLKIYTCNRDEIPLNEQIFGVFAPPYWPSSLAKVSGAQCIEIEPGVSFKLDHFTVLPFIANHPDKTLSFHITDGEKLFVHLLDSEVDGMPKAEYNKLLERCHKADLIIFDAAYSSEDYPRLKGWGHSTVEQGVKVAKECNPKRMLFSHFGQQYTDEEIDSWTRFFEGDTEFIMGYDGVELQL